MKTTWFKLLVVGLGLAVLPASAKTFYVNLNNSAPVSPFTNWPSAATNIQDAIDVATNGDLVLVTNGVYATGGRVVSGSINNRVTVDRPLTVQSVNGPAVTTIVGQGGFAKTYNAQSARCVYLAAGSSLSGFTLTNGAAGSGGGVYCYTNNTVVTNCIIIGNYGGGAYQGKYFNCTFQSNSSLSLGGGGAVAYGVLTNCLLFGNQAGGGGGAYNSTLSNCIISNNTALGAGGGVYGSTLTACLVTGNSETSNDGGGGGAAFSILNNCIISYNNAVDFGGGMNFGTATNCLIIGNTTQYTGGGCANATIVNCDIIGNTANLAWGDAAACLVDNCILYYNSVTNFYSNVSGFFGQNLNNSCTATNGGGGNITNEPAFVNMAGGDFHLSSNSPCINAGKNSFVVGTNDLDGNPRIVGGTVDIGCYEYKSPASVLSYAWAQQYGLPTDGSADFLDSDGTGMNNWQKWIAGLNPTNPASVLAMNAAVAGTNYTGLKVTWQSVNTRSYYLQRSSDLTHTFSVLQSNLVGQTGTTTYTDVSATNAVPYFYRVGVQ